MHCRNILYSSVKLRSLGVAQPLATSAQTRPLPSKESNQGQVTVTVTPLTLSNRENWRFAVQCSTHIAPISQEVAAASVLSDGKGHDEKPLAWQGDLPGGHHRKGVLVFKPVSPQPDSVTLTIRQIGSVPDRTFTWKLNGQ